MTAPIWKRRGGEEEGSPSRAAAGRKTREMGFDDHIRLSNAINQMPLGNPC